MLTTLLRRIVTAVVFFFAAYAFAFMPLGEKTALEHVLAIVRTPQAQRAGAELKTGAERLVKRLRDSARTELDSDTPPEEPEAKPLRRLVADDAAVRAKPPAP